MRELKTNFHQAVDVFGMRLKRRLEYENELFEDDELGGAESANKRQRLDTK